MKRFVIIVVGCVFLGAAFVSAQDAKKVEAGKQVYSAKECAKCHMIAGKGNKIGKLDGVAAKVSADDMRKWLTNPAQMEAKLDHKPKVKMSSKLDQMKLKDTEIDALIAYLQTLK
jgi:mono/diheme cytochrome c family protein